MNIINGRATVHLASALVPTLTNPWGESTVRSLLIVFSVILFASFPVSYSIDAYVLNCSGIAYVDIIGCAFLIVDVENMDSSGNIAAAQLGGRLLRVCIFARHLVLVLLDWSASTSAARRASPKLEVATHLFDLTATRFSLLLAASAAVVAGSKGGNSSSTGISAMALLVVLVCLALLMVGRTLDSALVSPVEKLLGLITLGASGVLESLDKDTGDLKPSRLKRNGTLLEDGEAKEAGGRGGGGTAASVGMGGGVSATNGQLALSAERATQNMADASGALVLTQPKDDVSAHAVASLALAMSRTLTSQLEHMAKEETHNAHVAAMLNGGSGGGGCEGGGGGGGGCGTGGRAGSAGSGGSEKATGFAGGGGSKTVARTQSYDDRVVTETWYPISTLGNPMLDFLSTQRHASDDHVGFTVESMKGQWEFDVLRLKTRSEVLALVYRTFETQGLLDHFGLSPTRVHKFVLEVADRYLSNHYHNLWHGADVCFTVWRLLHESECVEWMTPVEVLAALLAAYGHDVGHPGVNNAYLVATSSDLALLHNDHSPLENMHSTLLAAVLRDTAVLEPLTLGEAREARKMMISAILGTDMMHHFSQISDLRIFYEANGCLLPSYGGVSASETMVVEETKRRFILDMFVHAADVGNPAKEWVAGKSWSFLVMDEFWNQGDRERELSLPVGPMNDRFNSNVALTQMGFAEHLIFPLFLVLIELFPSLEPLGRYITKNVGKWSQLRVNELVAELHRAQGKRWVGGGEVIGNGNGRVESYNMGDSEDDNVGEDEVFPSNGGDRFGGGGGGGNRGNAAVNVDQLEGMSEGERMECQELLQRGPNLDKALTLALETLIVLKVGDE